MFYKINWYTYRKAFEIAHQPLNEAPPYKLSSRLYFMLDTFL